MNTVKLESNEIINFVTFNSPKLVKNNYVSNTWEVKPYYPDFFTALAFLVHNNIIYVSLSHLVSTPYVPIRDRTSEPYPIIRDTVLSPPGVRELLRTNRLRNSAFRACRSNSNPLVRFPNRLTPPNIVQDPNPLR